MSIKYVFHPDEYFVRCIGMARGCVSRTLEMIYHPLPPQEGIGWRYIGGNAVTALVDAGMSRDGAVERLQGIHDDIRDNRVRKSQFTRGDRDKPARPAFAAPLNTYHLGYAQKILAKTVAMITQRPNLEFVVEHQAVYLGKCLPYYIEHIPFVAPYEAAVTIDWDIDPTRTLRRLRRVIRHVERFGLEECNTTPSSLRELAYDHY